MSKLQGKATPTEAMVGTEASRAIDPNLFVWPADHPALLGSRCADCAPRSADRSPLRASSMARRDSAPATSNALTRSGC